MSKLVYGKNGQVSFTNEIEKREAIKYILTFSNVDFDVHEDNQDQGAWAPEERIHFKNEEEGGSKFFKEVDDCGQTRFVWKNQLQRIL